MCNLPCCYTHYNDEMMVLLVVLLSAIKQSERSCGCSFFVTKQKAHRGSSSGASSEAALFI